MDSVPPYEAWLNVHAPQLVGCCFPGHLYQQLYDKLSTSTFDAGEYLQYAMDEDGELAVVAKRAMAANSTVVLIDHAWTFKMPDARKTLLEQPDLLVRMYSLMFGDSEEAVKEKNQQSQKQQIEAVWRGLWRFAGTYRLASESQLDVNSVWYMMDELGSRFQYSSSPNWVISPLLDVTNKVAYSIAWPTQDISANELCCRDYILGAANEQERKIRELVWFDLEDVEDICVQQYQVVHQQSNKTTTATTTTIDMNSNADTPAILNTPTTTTVPPGVSFIDKPYKVYADFDFLLNNLKDYELVSEISDADVVWSCSEWEKIKEFIQGNQIVIGQFPHDECIVAKDLLHRTAINSGEDHSWLCTTYDMTQQDDLVAFVGHYTHKARQGLENHWIIKPPRWARTMDMYVSNHLPQILRLMETGPRVVCEYISHPVLFKNTKVDLRLIVAVPSLTPLQAFVLQEGGLSSGFISVRHAQEEYDLEDLDTFHKHFTVDYGQYEAERRRKLDGKSQANQSTTEEPTKDIKATKIAEFSEMVSAIETTYHESWTDIQAKIDQCIISGLRAYTKEELKQCNDTSILSRHHGLYGVDIMLDASTPEDGIAPKILEFTFFPDLEYTAHKLYPNVAADILDLCIRQRNNGNWRQLL